MPLTAGQYLQHNRYRIDGLLGKGGMGAVYLAWDTSLDIPVAIKENLSTSPEAQKQFTSEAKILAQLSHPNLPRVTDFFSITGRGQYLVMDYIEGEDLQAMLQRVGRVPEAHAVAWISQICDALTYLHRQPAPIIHRDVKPANIKILPDGRAVLVDFGIAKIYDVHMATTIGAKGVTPGYSPPEQYGGGSTDARSDVYALGATLFHLLTGQKPPESVRLVVGAETLPKPRDLNPKISPRAERAILKAVEVTTSQRFQSADQLRATLSQGGSTPAPLRSPAVPPRGDSKARPPTPQPSPVPVRGDRIGRRSGRRFHWGLFALLGGIGAVGLVLIIAVLALIGSPPEDQPIVLTVVATATATASETVGSDPLSATPTSLPLEATATSVPAPTPVEEPPTATPMPDEPTWWIPDLEAEVLTFRTYESDYEVTARDEREYNDRFAQAKARYVAWELRLEYPEPGVYVELPSVVVYRDSSGSILTEYDHVIELEPDWTVSWHVASWGWDEPGEWDLGDYVVELYLEGDLIAAQAFEIYE